MTAKTKEVAVLTRRQVETILVETMGWEYEDVASFWKVAKRLGLRTEARPSGWMSGEFIALTPARAKPWKSKNVGLY
jgi:hypothetical protein